MNTSKYDAVENVYVGIRPGQTLHVYIEGGGKLIVTSHLPSEEPEFIDQSIDRLVDEFSTRVFLTLKERMGVKTIRDIVEMPSGDLQKCAFLNEKGKAEIRDILAARGVTLRE
jgi:DNA-directed RNA polymerase alpha subunit